MSCRGHSMSSETMILFILGRLKVPWEVRKTANFHNRICCSFFTYSVIFRKHAIAKTLINQAVINAECVISTKLKFLLRALI
jgi:hypothetical protein